MSTPSPAVLQYQSQHSREDKSKQLLVTYIISLCAASVAVSLRLVARRIKQASLQADDYMIIIGYVWNLCQVFDHNLMIPALILLDLYCCVHCRTNLL